MKRIGLLSDTHGSLPLKAYDFFAECDEIWLAGDIGSLEVIDALAHFKPLCAVYGNIDSTEVRMECPEVQIFECEEVKVLMMHIGGYPGHYDRKAVQYIRMEQPNLFVAGHSHILRVMYDEKYKMLYMNPGAAGKSGFHTVRTMIRFEVHGKEIKNLEVMELQKTAALP